MNSVALLNTTGLLCFRLLNCFDTWLQCFKPQSLYIIAALAEHVGTFLGRV